MQIGSQISCLGPDPDAIVFTDGHNINLHRLKNQMDRKMLRIMLLAGRIRFPRSDASIQQVEQQKNFKESAVQTDENSCLTTKKLSVGVENDPNYKHLASIKKHDIKEKRPLIRDRKPLTIKQNDFLICEDSNFSVLQEPEGEKDENSCGTLEMENIPDVQGISRFHKRNQSDLVQAIASLPNCRKTDRSVKVKPTTQRSMLEWNQEGKKYASMLVSEECKERMWQEVQSLGERMRKQPVDHNMRSNLLKKIEQRFKPASGQY